MPIINVVAAIIEKENKILATQRGYGEFKDKWEFPGGKIKEGETAQDALTREIKEELDIEIHIKCLLDIIEYDYPDFHLSMECFLCTIKDGQLELKEHEDAKWLDKENLYTIDWLPADLHLIDKIKEIL